MYGMGFMPFHGLCQQLTCVATAPIKRPDSPRLTPEQVSTRILVAVTQ